MFDLLQIVNSSAKVAKWSAQKETDRYRSYRCETCKESIAKPERVSCTVCQDVHYCSKSCFNKDRNGHQYQCLYVYFMDMFEHLPPLVSQTKCGNGSFFDIPSNPHHYSRCITTIGIKMLHVMHDLVKQEVAEMYTYLPPDGVVLVQPGDNIALRVEFVANHPVIRLVNFDTVQTYCTYFAFLYRHLMTLLEQFSAKKSAPGLVDHTSKWKEYRHFFVNCSVYLYNTLRNELKECYYYEVQEHPERKWSDIPSDELSEDGLARIKIDIDADHISPKIKEKYNTDKSFIYRVAFMSSGSFVRFQQIDDGYDSVIEQVKKQIFFYMYT